jgi:hypothetical protein
MHEPVTIGEAPQISRPPRSAAGDMASRVGAGAAPVERWVGR